MPLLDRDDSVLFVIDAQPGFLKKLDDDVVLDVVDRIRWITLLAGVLHIPLCVTEEEPEHNGETTPEIQGVLPPNIVRHTKPTFGLMGSPHIVEDANRHGRMTAVVVGLETDVCVAQSAIGLLDAGWRVVVIVDAVASPGSSHEQGLDRLRDAGVELLGTKALAYDWLGSVELANEVLGRPELQSPRGVML